MIAISKRALVTSVSLYALAGLLVLPSHAFAQGQLRNNGLEEITVTARKRDENLLEVPLTVTALSAQDIETRAIDQLNDIVDFSPGFFYGGATVGRADRSNRRLVMRGMNVNTDVQTRQGATMFIDGAPVLGSEIGTTENVERIEVVKGPQSAYFGRSTYAGAINVITKTPGFEFKGRVSGEYGRFGTTDFGVELEGPLVQDKVSFRVSGRRYNTDGQYLDSTDGTTMLGARRTTDFTGTLFAKPSDSFTAKARIHVWRDRDGPSASVGYGRNNGQEYFNCHPPGSTLVNLNGNNNWICGKVPFPKPDQIQADVTLTPLIAQNLLGNDNKANPLLAFAFDPQFLDGFGLSRRAVETSLNLNYELSSGIALSSISAYHVNRWASLDDIDRRSTASLNGGLNDTPFLNNSDLNDFSQELRITSAQSQRFRWLVGGNYSRSNSFATSGQRQTGRFQSANLGLRNRIRTTGIFGSLTYDIVERLSASIEGRYQWDNVNDGTVGGAFLSGTFKSFTPRAILDFKLSDATTLYASWARGNRPGEFNSVLVGLPQSVIDQVAQRISVGVNVPEEKLTNYELGIKGRFWDGRAQLTAAIYYAQWRNQHTPALTTALYPDNTTRTVTTVGAGGQTDLSGVELEGAVAPTDHLKFEGTFALNNTKILKLDCSDCALLLGFRDITGLNKRISTYPKYTASAGVSYRDHLTGATDWFARIDYIYKGTMFATNANLSETGASNRVNLRAGIETEAMRLEIYGTNVFNDKTLTGLQRLSDLAFTGANNNILTGALPDRPAWGLRASYAF